MNVTIKALTIPCTCTRRILSALSTAFSQQGWNRTASNKHRSPCNDGPHQGLLRILPSGGSWSCWWHRSRCWRRRWACCWRCCPGGRGTSARVRQHWCGLWCICLSPVGTKRCHNSFLSQHCHRFKNQIKQRETDLDENVHVLQIVPAPLVKGLQQLETVALRADVHLELGAVGWWVLVGVLARVEVSER